MKERFSLLLSSIGVFLLLPCVLTFFISGAETCAWSRMLDLETCLPALAQTQLSADYGMEMKKVQSVMTRSNVEMELEKGRSLAEIIYDYYKNWDAKDEMAFLSNNYREFQKAAEETRTEVLRFQGNIVPVPYHRISSKMTRSGAQVLPESDMDYLIPVESSEDQNAPGYTATVTIAREYLPRSLKIRERDESGYVLTLLADDKIISGEMFRIQMRLPSSCFSMEEDENIVRFFCKGQGHGLGLSQYGGSVLENEGMTYEEILYYYFPELALEQGI